MRLFDRASALAALGALLPSCSVLLDWGDYTGGLTDAATDDATSVEEGPDAAAGDSGNGAPEAAPSDADPDTGTDTGTDGPPACDTHCMGCCSAAGDCQGGLSDNSCGSAGEACLDCQSTGLACVDRSCAAAPPSEAGSQTCSLSSCSPSVCIPVWQSDCCKSDGTCGCQVLIPKGSCM
jgi:hypothetical protein